MLQSVEIENFLSHKNTKLTFDRGVTVFVGQNGAGKSSIIDAITFALFGEHLRKSTKGLLRRGSNQSYSKVEFSLGHRQFEAVRKIDSKGTAGAVLYEKINGEMVSLVAGERKQFGESMTKEIESLIGLDFEKLKVASIVQQGELQAIIEADPRKFKELVNAIVGIDKLDIAYESMKKTIDSFRGTIKSRLGHDDTDIDTLQARIDVLLKEISVLEPQKKKIMEEKILREQEFSTLEHDIEIETPKETKIKEIEREKEDLLRYIRDSIVKMKRDLVEKEKKFSDCSNSLSVTKVKLQVESDTEQIQLDIDNIQAELKQVEEKITIIQSQQDIANKLHLVDGKCPVCDSSVDKLNPLFDEKYITFEIEALKKKKEDITKKNTSIQSKKKEFDLKLQQIIKAEGILASNNIKTHEDLTKLEEEISKLQVSTQGIPHEINSGNLMQYAIDEYSTDVIKSITRLVDETRDFDINHFRDLKSRLEQKRKALGMLDQEITVTNTKLVIRQEDAEKISQILLELHKVKQYVTGLEAIRSKIYNRDGPVATSLRSWALNMISQKASEYLSTFNVKIQRITLEDKSRDVGITCYSGNLEIDLESLSGGEKMSVALALRLGMAHFMGTSNLNFIILDEPTTHLDQERRKSLVNVLSQAFESNIDAISQFIIITHDSDIFENSNIDAIYDFKSTPEGTVVTPI
ncbi:AAA family ATPase [Candidatus Nitrosotalea okcheonensis]|uniref:SMC domain-containing protein n=1 Tax=Candidatus Nitrosotalea okcheonensis TaxID=1903276 RepID=A0A2H1FCV5_9ARCH|nr:SMC family ATPase [Candidatus Nitrosotalea okcheonensis]MDE1840846.1 SMC family ATPase [Nitrososphaerota archaeon]SMH70602.1 SMC domain-containing protein [Candidatus Nitrosotalea okcheonensis]